jgi:predicted nucleic acid-binding protein
MPASESVTLARAIFPSNELGHLRDVFKGYPEIKMWGNIRQEKLIIDSSVVIKDLLWLAKHREDQAATTALQECIQASVVIPLVPQTLQSEVENRLPQLAKEQKIDLDLLIRLWQDYRKVLVFREAQQDTASMHDVRDPNDMPFIWLWRQSKASAIVTQDHDIPAMGARCISTSTLMTFRDYARSTAFICGYRLTIVVWALIISILVLPILRVVCRFFVRHPILAVGIIASAAFLCWVYWSDIKRKGQKLIGEVHFEGVLKIISMISHELSVQKELAVSSERVIEDALNHL